MKRPLPSAEVRNDIARKLIAIPPPDLDVKRRAEVQDLTTVLFCDQLNEWVRLCSGLKERWTDAMTWELIKDALCEEVIAPLALSASHLLALRGPYTSSTPVPGGDGRTLGDLVDADDSPRERDSVGERFVTESMMRRRFVAPLVSATLGRHVPANQIREIGDRSGKRLSPALRALANTVLAILQERMDELEDDGWENLTRDLERKRLIKSHRVAIRERLNEIESDGWIFPGVTPQDGQDGRGGQSSERRAPLGLSIELLDAPEAQPLPNLQSFSNQSVEELFQLSLALERLALGAAGRRRLFRFADYLDESSVARYRIETLLWDEPLLLPNFLNYVEMHRIRSRLEATYDGRRLVRALGALYVNMYDEHANQLWESWVVRDYELTVLDQLHLTGNTELLGEEWARLETSGASAAFSKFVAPYNGRMLWLLDPGGPNVKILSLRPLIVLMKLVQYLRTIFPLDLASDASFSDALDRYVCMKLTPSEFARFEIGFDVAEYEQAEQRAAAEGVTLWPTRRPNWRRDQPWLE